jgi:methylase of polypeptide subunit release factors
MPAAEQTLPRATQLLGERTQGPVRTALGRVLGLVHRITGAHRQERVRLEQVHDTSLIVLPSVFNPRLLRTGAYFASVIAQRRLGAAGAVLDLGTGTGVCAVFAARHARRVVAVDINHAAVKCAALNAALNHQYVDCRQGDLFTPVGAQRFDAIFFNPPFVVGAPLDARDCAWRSTDVAARFAAGLEAHLAPGGHAYLLLSTFGDACALFIEELAARHYDMAVLATKRYINERVTIVDVRAPARLDVRAPARLDVRAPAPGAP